MKAIPWVNLVVLMVSTLIIGVSAATVLAYILLTASICLFMLADRVKSDDKSTHLTFGYIFAIQSVVATILHIVRAL